MNDALTIRNACTRNLVLHGTITAHEWIARLATVPEAALPLDLNGVGGAVERLEAELADILGTEAVMFCTKGVIAQQIALRIWTDRARNSLVALHPKTHFLIDEGGPLDRLHPIVPVPLGGDDAPFTVDDLVAAGEAFGAITVELPIRRAGFLVTPWSDLVAIADHARARGTRLHFDGARAWEIAHAYGCEVRDIAALADSIYVSFYKGVGGIAGCVLGGPADFIAEARVWRKRMGGITYTNFPAALAALDGMRRHRPRLTSYLARAREIAESLAAAGFDIEPAHPQVSAFRIYVRGSKAALEDAHLRLATEQQTWFFDRAYRTGRNGTIALEIMVGEGAFAIGDAEIVDALQRMLGETNGAAA